MTLVDALWHRYSEQTELMIMAMLGMETGRCIFTAGMWIVDDKQAMEGHIRM